MTSEHPILGQVALGYSPIIDRNRAVIATRLTVFPLRPDATLDAAAAAAAVGEVWPEGGGSVSLNVLSETLLHDLLQAEPSANLMVEVPAFMAGQPDNVAALQQLQARGNMLLLKGRPVTPLPREVLPCFKYSIIDLADERRVGEAARAARRDAQHRARAVGRAHPGRSWRRASSAAPLRCSAGRSTMQSRSAPAARARRDRTCR